MKKQIHNAILGFCLADAVGVPFEFQSMKERIKKPATDMIGYGTYHLPVGVWSDDSSMTLALADSLAHTYPEIDYRDIMERFADWSMNAKYTATGKVFDIGITCNEAISNYKMRGIEPLKSGATGEHSCGNGSLMRILPMAFYIQARYSELELNDESMEWIFNVSSLTHATMRNNIASGIYIFLAMEIMKLGKLKEGIRSGMKKAFAYFDARKEYQQELKYYERLRNPDEFSKTPKEEISGSGYVVSTLETVIWSLMGTDDYKSAVLKCINQGEDTDTTAAIAGGLAGLSYDLPEDWLAKLKNKELIVEICDKLDKTIVLFR